MNRYLRYILLPLLPLALASCIYEDAPTSMDDANGQVQVTFTLATGNARADASTTTRTTGPGTRADNGTWGDAYLDEDGIDPEVAIAPGDLSVWFCSADDECRRLVQVENLTYERNPDGQSYTYSGRLTADRNVLESGKSYKLMVLANCGNPASDVDFEKLVFEQGVQYIPMWGVHTINDLTLERGQNTDLGNVTLLRAMAKIEITIDSKIRDTYSLTAATLNRYNKEGFCLPGEWKTVSETKDLNRENGTPRSFNPNTINGVGTNLSFRKATDDGTEKLVCYVPEYAHDPAHPAQLSITINGDEKKKFTLELSDDPNNDTPGNYYDLVRNHIYHYNITDVFDGELTVNYEVQPWDAVAESEIEYSEQIGWQLVSWGITDLNTQLNDLSLGDQDARFCVLTFPNYADNTETSSIAEFGFHYPKPMGTVWTAHLSNTVDFEFVKEDGYATTGIDRDGMYKIGIRAKNSWTDHGSDWEANHTLPSTYLYITISYDGEHQEELVINPIHTSSDGGTNQVTNPIYKEKRRFPGTDNRIWIRQVPAKQGYSLWDLAKDVPPGETDYEWWRVNPYWDHDYASQTQQ